MRHLFNLIFLSICFHSVHAQNVGIGTQTPQYPLTVYSSTNGIVQEGPSVKVGTGVSAFAGYIKTFTNHPLHFATNNGPSQMVLTTAGQIGLGTALPAAKLHMTGNMNDMLLLENTTALANGVTNEIAFKTGAYYTGMIITNGQGSTAARMSFYTQASGTQANLVERMTILNNGYVGINNASPVHRLDVNGAANINGELTINGPLTKPATGNMSWLPIVIAKVDIDGIVVGGTGNITVQKLAWGNFKISIAGENDMFWNKNKYAIHITPFGGIGGAMANVNIGNDNKIEVNLTKPAVHYWNNECSCDVFSKIVDGQFYDPLPSGFSMLVYKF